MGEQDVSVVARGEHERDEGLGDLVGQGAGRRALHPGDLHGDGGRAGDHLPGGEVLADRAHHRLRINAGVGPEAAVLQGQGGGGDTPRHGIEGPGAEVLIVAAAHLAEQLTVAVEQGEARRRRLQGGPRGREEHPGEGEDERDEGGEAAAGHELAVGRAAGEAEAEVNDQDDDLGQICVSRCSRARGTVPS
jgi:hypothetical protein